MANLGKKILSAFVEVNDDKKPETEKQPSKKEDLPTTTEQSFTSTTTNTSYTPANSSKFKDYFEKLFREANLPGPDYFEYSKMLEAMQAVPDEHVRFITAFAGLSVQGLDKQKLLSTAGQYLQLLETDAQNFHSSVDTALQEKVVAKKRQLEEKEKRIQQLTQEISALQNDLLSTQAEIKENEAKIEANTGGYKYESEAMKNRIARDIEKIKTYIQ
jgi:predicted PolB exonuclease-like 3'-5' exonuclease